MHQRGYMKKTCKDRERYKLIDLNGMESEHTRLPLTESKQTRVHKNAAGIENTILGRS